MNTYTGFVTVEPDGRTIYLDSFRPERISAEVHCCTYAVGLGGRYPNIEECERLGYRVVPVRIELTLLESKQAPETALGDAQ